MRSLELDVEKINNCKNILLENYFNTSIVEQAVDTLDYNEAIHRDLNFLKFGKWYYIPKKWFTDPSIYPDLVFSGIGRGIAIGEKKHIVEKILANDNVNRITLGAINYGNIREIVHGLVSEMEMPLSNLQFILFAPIEYFVAMHIDWAREQHQTLIWEGELIVDNFRVKLFWSNKYVDYKEFVISEKSLCGWIARPNVNSRLEVEIRESDRPENMELKAQTAFNFTIRDPKKIRVLQPTQPPET